MKLLNFTIIKLTLCLIVGILIGHFFSFNYRLVLALTLSLFTILLVVYLLSRKQFQKTIWFGLSAFLLMAVIGIASVTFHNEKHFKNHYTHYLNVEKDSIKTITFRIREVLKPSMYHNKYIVDILKVDQNDVCGKTLLNVEKDTINPSLKVDEFLIAKTAFKAIGTSLNPCQFDYQSFLEKKYIYHQMFASNRTLFKLETRTQTLFGIADGIRNHINSKLKTYPFTADELSIINALLLGQRQDISDAVYTSYTNAGAIHILAVSGLHVGIILLILNFSLKPLERFKYGKSIKTILLVILLWSFAIIAGLSASVTRAVTMFFILTIGLNLKRPTNVINTLAISIFILLLFKPMFLFDVGFQLSYLAVLAIVILDPMLYKLWQPKNYILDTLWHTLTVTVSAQVGVIPISLYYFHQLPGLFFVSNLVIIPFLGIILGIGILVMALAVLNLLPVLLAKLYGYLIALMNSFIAWVSHQEAFLFKDIAFGLLHVIISYTLIIALVNLWKQRSYKSMKFLLIAVIITQSAALYTIFKKPKNQFIVFHKSRFTLIGNHTPNALFVANDFDNLAQTKDHVIRDFVVGNHIKHIEQDSLQSVYLINQKTLLVIDSLGLYQVKSFQPNYVLLRQSPKINLNRLIDSIKPKRIIADGSNYKSYVENWKLICKKRKLPFHQTSEKGAFIIDY